MIKNLKLKFFQSWKEVKLIFDKGLNIIIGSSNSGKSALLRAIYWVIENRPSGNSFAHYSQLKNGNIEGEVSVEIETEKGIVKRSKNKNFNGYFLNDKKFEAIGLDIPEDVNRFFNFSEINIQKQLDSPFLLSESGGEIAKFFNKILKLDSIDLALKKIDELKRDNSKELNNKEQEIKEINLQLKKLDWLDEYKIKIDKLDNIKNKIYIEQEKLKNSNLIFNSLVDIDNKLTKYDNLEILIDKINELIELNSLINEKLNFIDEFKKILDLFSFYENEKIKYNFDFEILDKNINLAIEVYGKMIEKNKKIKFFNDIFIYFNRISKEIEDIDRNLNENLKNLPNICPICGNFIIKEKILEIL